MAEAVVTFALEQLGGLLIDSILQEAKFLHGVNDQVDHAKAELRRMRCFLKDADARARGGDERVRNWVAEIREATCDLEDAVLTYAAEVVPRRKGGVKNSLKRLTCLFGEGVKLHHVGSKIEKISDDISALRSSLETYGIRELPASGSEGSSSSNERQRELRRAYSHVVESDTVGIENNIKELVSCLTEERKSHRVVSICGMGGLGKTTLARKVYQHSKIRGHFDCVAWASISQQCQVSSVWEEILLKVAPNLKGTIRDVEICGKLYNIQKERKCLIVLDDIWTTEIWDRLSNAFPRDETRSKILLTTRNKDLALYADGKGIIHEPRCLDDTESWELFAKAFKGSQTDLEDEERKKKLGKEMLKHCGGLPLAIIVLRGLLSRKQSVYEWEAMQKNAKMYINEGNISTLHDSSGVSWVLGLSYDELPYQLKPCFLHLANFPEDHEIRVNELCRIWMAEGFVSSEDMAYECLYELVQRCMLLEGASNSIDRRIRTCRMHDLMRDLCLSKAHGENFLKVVYFLDGHEGSDSLSSSNKVRRLAMLSLNPNNVSDTKLLPIIRNGSLRSFVCFDLSFLKGNMKPWFNSFYMLRVLKFEDQDSTSDSESLIKMPNEIGKLFHLRFLSLRDSSVHLLPSSISKLRYLQTLDLRVRSGGIDLFTNVVKWRLDQLRHLYFLIPSFLRDNALILENAHSLRTLVGIRTSYPGFNHLAQLIDLTKLGILYDKHWQGGVTFNNLRKLAVVTENFTAVNYDVTPIILSCPRIYKLKVKFRIVKLPEVSQFSPELVKLTLDWTEIKNDPMPTLEKLPKLRFLHLLKNASTVDEIVCSGGGFTRLESLYFSYMSMREWRVEKGALPSLCHITLDNCSNLRTIPDGLRFVTTLKEIVCEGFESEATRKLKKRLDEFNKVRHVPSLVLNTKEFD